MSGSLEVVLADYGITPPERDFVAVTDVGTMEVQLVFETRLTVVLSCGRSGAGGV